MNSNLTLFPRGSLFMCRVELCMARWGGGADHGKWHVFWSNATDHMSIQCVVDDFGDLIEVRA